MLVLRVEISATIPAKPSWNGLLLAVLVAAGATLTLPPVMYSLDHTQPLLIAFDFNATAGLGNVRRRNNVPAAEATVFGRNNTAQADLQDRSPDFTPNNQIILVNLIEVA